MKELLAEKMRAAATRLTIAPRDFYDLGYFLNAGFNFTDPEFLYVFKKKIAEDNFPTDLRRYSHDLGRTQKEIDDMSSRIAEELLPVLPIEIGRTFNIHDVLKKMNETFKNLK